MTLGQRVLNLHPAGGSMGEGTSPSSSIRLRKRSFFGFGCGTAESRACVYGWYGFLRIRFLVSIQLHATNRKVL